MTTELSNFAKRLRDLIRARAERSDFSPLPDKEFNQLALELFKLQFASNSAYRKICESRGVSPGKISEWKEIPAVPTGAFKEFELTSLAPSERTHVFHSSGTTAQKPSRHFHNAESLAVYEASLWPWFRQNVLRSENDSHSTIPRLLILTPSPSAAPNSSLVHMFEIVRRNLGVNADAFLGKIAQDGSWTLEFDKVIERLSNCAIKLRDAEIKRQNSRLLLLGTAFSFVHLLDALVERNLAIQLPAGSRVMETGGYKGRSRALPKSELHSLISERLGISQSEIICEYGMSELSSQAYDSAMNDAEHFRRSSHVTRCFRFPPWARVQMISPETGREVCDGETGLIRVCDLANVFSVTTLQTEDLAVRRRQTFELIGRAEFAEPGGCSLMAA